jgi:hypothetical protein
MTQSTALPAMGNAPTLSVRDGRPSVADSEPKGSDLLCLRDVPMGDLPPSQPASAQSSRPQNIREFEAKLRESFGFSSREAKAVASRGWSALAGPAQQEPPLDELAAMLTEAAKQFNQY